MEDKTIVERGEHGLKDGRLVPLGSVLSPQAIVSQGSCLN